MRQFFHPAANTVAKVSIVGLALGAGLLYFGLYQTYNSSYRTGRDVAVEQKVPFSHFHHVKGLGIDCRYCHTSVEEGPFAGIPPTKTCFGCHQQIWKDAPMLEPVRASYKTGKPLVWARVHNLGDFVYFNHQIHVAKGIGCASCHGRVDEMPLMRQKETLFMQWCLDCHRDPSAHVRPKDQIFNMDWEPPADYDPGKVAPAPTNCSTCHR
jgi:hypothetical protein